MGLIVETWKLKVEGWNLKLETWNLKRGPSECSVETWKLKLESWRLKLETWNLKRGPSECSVETWKLKLETWSFNWGRVSIEEKVSVEFNFQVLHYWIILVRTAVSLSRIWRYCKYPLGISAVPTLWRRRLGLLSFTFDFIVDADVIQASLALVTKKVATTTRWNCTRRSAKISFNFVSDVARITGV